MDYFFEASSISLRDILYPKCNDEHNKLKSAILLKGNELVSISAQWFGISEMVSLMHLVALLLFHLLGDHVSVI